MESWRYFYCVAAAADGIKSLISKAERSDILGFLLKSMLEMGQVSTACVPTAESYSIS